MVVARKEKNIEKSFQSQILLENLKQCPGIVHLALNVK